MTADRRKVPFVKLTGAGNDFILIDNRSHRLSLAPQTIAWLCDRHFGVGADGVLLVEQGDQPGRTLMRYFNCDGTEAESCGNGARCFARFLAHQGFGNSLCFDTKAGPIEATVDAEGVSVKLPAPQEVELHRFISTAHGPLEVHFVKTGVPHLVVFVRDLESVPIRERGAELRHHPAWSPAGANVNFVQVTGSSSIGVRTYERGVEDETLACGTGVAASALVAYLVKQLAPPIEVTVKSRSILRVEFAPGEPLPGQVVLRGPAEVVFSGEVELRDPTL
ncbi:diaminopimelate epimerase [Candidatus Methylacidithermus pantelleriae]|uniref:Diaminopimelate epimerase n=1 Tax=Candidatus Methylacidithermus pantelleriae TaxID=2744239 RepID=A0A8J2FVQ4_9BACT|nr:diaminopimelate epimerase [Candidatus Methylacidithermus pantelleriae]CAF0694949.1 Diaminopimelate epimerase [Candidatus Methylacidithermus pantelleriae]